VKSVLWDDLISCEACAILLFEGQLPGAAPLGALAAEFQRHCDTGKFSGRKEQILRCLFPGGRFPQIFAVGMGSREKATLESWRCAAAEALRGARKAGVRELVLLAPDAQDSKVAMALTEGALLANDQGLSYQTSKRGNGTNGESSSSNSGGKNGADAVETMFLADGHEDGVQRGIIWAESQIFARSLANEPGNIINPQTLAERAQRLAQEEGLACDVWDDVQIRDKGLEALWSVGKGSVTPPRLIHLSYVPQEGTSRKRVVLVGKGLTFDSGGLSLKTSESMRTMKGDKSGACAVFGVLRGIARAKPDIEVHAFVGAAENMPDGKSYRPDDILRTYKGKTIEIDNTDAEGRVTLADTLALASELAPDALVDIATLTGACGVALGDYTAGLFASDDGLAEALLAASRATGERVWRMPLDDELLRKKIQSPIADLLNSGGRTGGAITAAMFLQEFVAKDVPWAHLDIAAVDFYKEPFGYYNKGASGFGVRLLLDFVLSL